MKIVIDPYYRSLQSYIEQLPSTFDEGETIYAARNILRRFCWNGISVVVKKYKIPILVNRFIYGRFRKSKARRSYEYARILQEKGFRTPTAVAYIESYRCGLFADSYLVTLEETFSQMMRVFHTDESFTDKSRPILQGFAAYTARLHEAGILHHDYSPGNIAFDTVDGKAEFSLFDINRMSFGKISKRKCLRNFCRLTPSRPILEYIVTEYARIRGWERETSVREAVKAQKRFFTQASRRHERKLRRSAKREKKN